MSNIHVMEVTPRRLTKVGLFLEGLSIALVIPIIIYFDYFNNKVNLMNLDPDLTSVEADMIIEFLPLLYWVLIVMVVLQSIFFIINMHYFRGLYKERYTNEFAKKIYMYQFVYGIVNLFFNTLVGVLYLISGNQGRLEQEDNPYTREGL